MSGKILSTHSPLLGLTTNFLISILLIGCVFCYLLAKFLSTIFYLLEAELFISYEGKIKVQLGEDTSKYRYNEKVSKKPTSRKETNKGTRFDGFFDYLKELPKTVNLLLSIINSNILLITAIIYFIIARLK